MKLKRLFIGATFFLLGVSVYSQEDDEVAKLESAKAKSDADQRMADLADWQVTDTLMSTAKPNAVFIPAEIEIGVHGICLPQAELNRLLPTAANLGRWQEQYGIQLTPLGELASRQHQRST